jgi:hypothetical protein
MTIEEKAKAWDCLMVEVARGTRKPAPPRKRVRRKVTPWELYEFMLNLELWIMRYPDRYWQ